MMKNRTISSLRALRLLRPLLQLRLFRSLYLYRSLRLSRSLHLFRSLYLYRSLRLIRSLRLSHSLHLLRGSFVRYLLSGVVNTAVGLTVSFSVLHGLRFSYWTATACGFLVGWIVGFVLSRHYTFRSRPGEHLSLRDLLPKYALTVLVAYVLSAWFGTATSTWVAKWLSWPAREDWAVLSCNGCYILLNYTGQRWFVFREGISRSTPIR